jgi:beta-glucosidase
VNVPAPVALAATWDPRQAELIGSLLAAECRRTGVHVLLAPTVNLQRSPFGGRNFEFLGEDPLLTAAMGTALGERNPARWRGCHGQALRG